MSRPADQLRAQLAAEDSDFVAALLDDTVQIARLGRNGLGFRYPKGGRMRDVFGAEITHLPDGTEVDTDLIDAVTEDQSVTPFEGRVFRSGGYGMRLGGVTVRFGGPERRIGPGNWGPVVLSNPTRRGEWRIWDDPWGGVFGVGVRSTGVDTRWTFVVQPPAIRVALIVTGSIVSPDGTVPLPDGESFTIEGAKWRDSTVDAEGNLAPRTGLIPFTTQGGYIPLVLPAGLTFPVTVDG